MRIKAPEELRRKLNEIDSSLNLFSSHRVGNFAPTAPSLNTSVPSPKSPLTSEPFLCFVVPFVSEEKKRKSGSIHGRRRLLVRYFLSKYFLKITALFFYSFAIPWFVCISDKFISFRTDASLVQLFDWLTRILLSCQLPERRRDFIFFCSSLGAQQTFDTSVTKWADGSFSISDSPPYNSGYRAPSEMSANVYVR